MADARHGNANLINYFLISARYIIEWQVTVAGAELAYYKVGE
jgi:hypothetical protein